MTEPVVVDAVVIKRHTNQECPHCQGPLASLSPHIELGTVYRIQPATRRMGELAGHGGQMFLVDLVRRDGGDWIPVELLNWPGKT